jgi:uncharacterized protein YndB with AHSA1/START domain
MVSSEISTALDRDTVRATGYVPAPPRQVFEYLRRPANHRKISGDQSVRGTFAGPPVLGPGDRFGMRMHVVVPYRVTSTVVEFEPHQRIAWCHFGGHRWRWELEPAGDGTKVTETFDQSTARGPLPALLRWSGYPRKHRRNVATSVARLAVLLAP